MDESKITIMPSTTPYEELLKAWYVQDVMLNFVFFKVRDRIKAQAMADEYFGAKGKYTVRKNSISKSGDERTATGTATRKGQKKPN